MNPSFPEGFKSDQILSIASLCPNLNILKVPCMFDQRYIGYVDDQTLHSLSSNCPRLQTLHLVDISALSTTRGSSSDAEDAAIGAESLIDMFSSLPLLEELVLDVCSNVRESKVMLEHLHSKCPRLKTLKVGHFHGLCTANDPTLGSKLDGIAMCQQLESLSIRNSADLTDFGLVAIAKGCSRLARFEIEGCDRITVKGMRLFVSLLHRSLVDVRISRCKNLGAVSSLRALEPIQDRVLCLHIDCIWDGAEQFEAPEGIEYDFDLNEECFLGGTDTEEMGRTRKKCRTEYDLNCSYAENGNGYHERTWDRLCYLSLWISVGELLTPLVDAGLENCPNLEEIEIKVEGDSRDWSRPSQRAFGLSSLCRYASLKKLRLDCKDTIGNTHTAPSGQTDLSLWERFYLNGIGSLMSLDELDYWPPQDQDVNQRSLSLPAVGLLGECTTLRKLFIHGSAHEHFMMELLRIPKEYLRDVQLREDYYPAPENDMSTEMRANSYARFEDALNSRPILD